MGNRDRNFGLSTWTYIVLGLTTSTGIIALNPDSAIAQSRITADTTLGAESSIVIQNFNGSPNEVIGGGALRGQNLFHSLLEFNVSQGRGAYFFVPTADVQNVLARVTGNTRSEISGVLGTFAINGGNFVQSGANLFFINPNGIIFGPGASLDIGGSFVASTANAVQFGDQGVFSATNPEAPPLLTVNPSAFLFNQLGAGSIGVNSTNLQVPDGQILGLLGGNVTIDNSRLDAWSGRIEVGAVGGPGLVALNENGSFGFTDEVERADVTLNSNALIDVTLDTSGDIRIIGQNIVLSGGSGLLAGIASGFGTTESQAGNLILDATREIQVMNVSFVGNIVSPNATGNGGNAVFIAPSLVIKDGSQITASTYGQGNAGDVVVTVHDRILIEGTNIDENISSGIGSEVGNTGIGQGGSVRLSTRNLLISRGGGISASTFGQGDAGDVVITSYNNVLVDGTSANGLFRSAIGSQVLPNSVGLGGNIQITTNSFSVSNGAQISTSTFGRGDAGNISIMAYGHVFIDGTTFDGLASSVIESRVAQSGNGQGGNVQITTEGLSVANGAAISASTYGQGNAGSVTIEARDRVVLDSISTNGQFYSGIASRVELTGSGQGGDVQITTGDLLIRNGAGISVGTNGQGNSGNVFIRAHNQVLLDGVNISGQRRSSIGSQIESSGNGQGGDIHITAGNLSITDGAVISATTFGQGNAGDIFVTAHDRISLDGTSDDERVRSAIVSEVAPIGYGQGGDVRITAEDLFVSNGALLSTTTLGQGNAGNIFVTARDHISLDGTSANGQLIGGISSQIVSTRAEKSGDIRVTAETLSIGNGASISASTFGQGDAGNIFVTVLNRITIDGISTSGQSVSSINSQVESMGIGQGGNVQIATGSLFISNGGQISAGTRGQGNSGNITVAGRDRISIDGISTIGGFSSGIFSAVSETAVGQGGNVRVTANNFSLTNGAVISAATLGLGDAGDISVITRDRVFLDGVNSIGELSGLFTFTAGEGLGGRITLNADSLLISRGAVINAQTFSTFQGGDVLINANTLAATAGGQILTTTGGQGRAGNITLNLRDSLLLSGTDPTYTSRLRRFPNVVSNQGASSGLFANTTRSSSGQGGTIRVNTPALQLDNQARIEVNSEGNGVAGDLLINTTSIEMDNRSRLTASTLSADGGNIVLQNLDYLLLRNGSGISTSAGTARAGGNGGNITIGADFIVAVPSENSDITANAFSGQGGNVDISTEGLFGIAIRPQLTPLSDITASSERGVQGVVTITPPTVDPSRGLAELPVDLTDASQLISQNCPSGGNSGELGEFIVTGRGGLPPNPTQLLGNETVLTQLASAEDTPSATTAAMPSPPDTPAPLVEAQGWIVNTDGQVMLVAYAPHAPVAASSQCHPLSSGHLPGHLQ